MEVGKQSEAELCSASGQGDKPRAYAIELIQDPLDTPCCADRVHSPVQLLRCPDDFSVSVSDRPSFPKIRLRQHCDTAEVLIYCKKCKTETAFVKELCSDGPSRPNLCHSSLPPPPLPSPQRVVSRNGAWLRPCGSLVTTRIWGNSAYSSSLMVSERGI